MIDWISLVNEDQLKEIKERSFQKEILGVAIFKHSTRCYVSKKAKEKLEREWNLNDRYPAYFLDLLAYRNISNKISEEYQVEHQSPQLLIIKDGICITHASHEHISTHNL